MDNNKPIPMRLLTIADPPCEIKGKGIPVRGKIPVTAPIFSNMWKTNIMMKPVEI
jgi:hypothetical protein